MRSGTPRTRLRATLGALLALALGVTGVAASGTPASAATTKHAVSVSMKVSATRVKSGQRVTVSGVVKDKVTKKHVKGVKVVVQQRVTGSPKWVNVVTRKTNARGKYSAKVRENVNVTVRVVVKAGSKTKARTSAVKRVYAAQTITLISRTNKVPTNADKRGYSKMTYQASPGLRGKYLVFQSRLNRSSNNASWETYDYKVKIPATGRVSLQAAWTCGELRFDVRGVVLATAGISETASPYITQNEVLCEDWRVAEREADRMAMERDLNEY